MFRLAWNRALQFKTDIYIFLSRAFKLDGLTLELPSCFVFIFLPLLFYKTITNINTFLLQGIDKVLSIEQKETLGHTTLYHSIGLLNATDLF